MIRFAEVLTGGHLYIHDSLQTVATRFKLKTQNVISTYT